MSVPAATAEALLNSPDYFTCDKYACRMSKQTCVANQRLAGNTSRVHFDAHHGCDFAAINRKAYCFECRQGSDIKMEMESEAMGKRGTCGNCGRPDVLLVPGMKNNICWSCQKYAAGTAGDERIKKLAEAAEKYGGKTGGEVKKISPENINKIKQCAKNLREKIAMKQESNPRPEEVGAVNEQPVLRSMPAELESAPGESIGTAFGFLWGLQEGCVAVHFFPDDKKLFEYLNEVCKRERRTPDQQILHMLDCHRQADLEAGLAIPEEILQAKIQLYT